MAAAFWRQHAKTSGSKKKVKKTDVEVINHLPHPKKLYRPAPTRNAASGCMMLVQLEPMVMWASQSLFVMGALQQLLDPDHPAVIALQIVLELRGGRRGHRGGVVRDDRFPLPDPGQALLHQRGVPGRVRRGLRRRPEVGPILDTAAQEVPRSARTIERPR